MEVRRIQRIPRTLRILRALRVGLVKSRASNQESPDTDKPEIPRNIGLPQTCAIAAPSARNVPSGRYVFIASRACRAAWKWYAEQQSVSSMLSFTFRPPTQNSPGGPYFSEACSLFGDVVLFSVPATGSAAQCSMGLLTREYTVRL